MIIKSPFDTLALSYRNERDLLHMADRAFALGENKIKVTLGDYEGEFYMDVLDGSSPHHHSVPAFELPIIYPTSSDSRNQSYRVVVDVRQCGTIRNGAFGLSIAGTQEFKYKIKLAILGYVWAQGAQKVVFNASDVPMRVFSNYISNLITNRFVLEPHQRLHVQALAAWYYCCQFSDKIHENERHGYLGKILRVMGTNVVSSDLIEKWLGDAPEINNPLDFCEFVASAIEGGQLENLNLATFNALLRATCFIGGASVGATIGQVAMEYPPAWIILIVEAALNRGMNRTGIGQSLERLKKDDLALFVHEIHRLIGGPQAIREFNYESFFIF